ncbi:MAG: class I SAM-dependent methyltransferase [Acidobacteria bacterium]|nr:class I SAM-dependent methyltransferase [Acidobacteriota bacterium]
MIKSKPLVAGQGGSRFTHGAVYHVLYDRPLAETRRAVVDAIPASSRVLDIACGTGELCFDLATRKGCQVVGVDLSPRMIEFARKRNRSPEVRFDLGDGTDLAHLGEDSFDIATILLLLHEIPLEKQMIVLNQALNRARRVIVVDSHVPLPKNLHGLALRIVEASGGPSHYRYFADYLASGGIGGILEKSSARATVTARSVFWHGCREIATLDRHEKATF